MRKLLSLFSLLASLAALAQSPRPSLVPWSTVSTNGQMLIAGDGQYLLFTGSEGVQVYDLKRRAMLATVPGIQEMVLEAPAEGPFFYTLASNGSGVQQRRLPLGELVESTPLPRGFETSLGLSPLIAPGPQTGTFFTAVNPGRSIAIAQFGKEGVQRLVGGLPHGEKVNAICFRSGRIWALTSNGLWKQRDSVFEKVSLPGEANYGNARFNGDTLIVLGRREVTWYDTKNNRVARQTPIPGFFGTDINDQGAMLLHFHHPFAIDASGKVWLTDTRRDPATTGLNYPPYLLALVGNSVEYPYRSSERSTAKWKTMGPQLAYDPQHKLLAAAGADQSIEFFDREAGALFAIDRKSLRTGGLRFTGRPGRILLPVETIGGGEPAVLLNLANGRLEPIPTISSRYMIPGNSVYTQAQSTGSSERIYHSLTGQWIEQPYLRYRDNVSLLYNDDETRVLPLPHKRTVTVSENGLLEYRDSSGKLLRSLQLPALQHELYGAADSVRLQLNTVKLIPFKGQHLRRAQYDSASALLYLRFMDAYSVSDATLLVIDLNTMKVVYQNTGTDMALLPGGKQFMNEYGIFELRTLKTVRLFREQQRSPEQFIVSHDGKRVYALIWNGYRQPSLYDREKNTWTALGSFEADELQLDPFSERLFAFSADKGIAIWDAQSGAPISRIVFAGNRNINSLEQLDPSYLALLPDGYYLGQNKYYQLLQLQQGGRSIGLAEMDGIFHRPDKVLRALGYATPASVGLLEKMAERRSSRFSGRFPESDAAIAALAALPFYQGKDRIRIAVRTPVTGYSGLMAYANGTALFDKPQPLAGQPEAALDVALVDAATNIRVCLVDGQGKETPGDFFYIQGKPAEDRELYVLGIGVSEYRNPQFNLRYAAKDMNDLSTFLKSTSSYKKVHVATWQNNQVTPAIADSIAARLRGARPQDVVLCYFAGHGLLDKAKNYFLATYEQDFNDPARGGLSIEALNRAVSANAARKRLILLDACHSGLVDDLLSAEPVVASDTTGQTSIVIRGVKVPGAGSARASELYFSFQNFGQGSGVDILAAAAGNEYALERGDLKNGVFTYSLLQAFSTGKADVNDDKAISLSELQRYVSARTTQLTRGAQQPTFRQANLYQDITLFRAGDTYSDQLMNAAKQNNVQQIRKLLADGNISVNGQDASGFTALHFAAREGNLAAAQALVAAGADVELRTQIGATPLYLAARNNNYATTYFLLTQGADMSKWFEWQRAELAQYTDSGTARLLRNYPQVRKRQDALLALANALGNSRLDLAETLLKAVPDINERLILEGAPVIFAGVMNDNLDATRWALDKGADVNSRTAADRYTPLMMAAYRGNEAMLRLLLERGASKTLTDNSGNNAAAFARMAGKTTLLPLLQ